ncbi:MAG: polyprenyl diphosphate synthase [Bilophila sp.]
MPISGDAQKKSALPAHIAVIMDGNGRWAQEHGLSRSEGHKAGVRAAKDIVTECRRLGIRCLTLYTFSQENWGRPQAEVSLLFQLLVTFLREELPSMERNDIRLHVFGDIDALPLPARTALRHAMSRTAHCTSMTVNLALNYSGREEVLRAVRAVLAEGLRPEELTETVFRSRLYSQDQPDPDLVIRTSGELRVSNFLIFQTAYSEFYFTSLYWPDFTPEELRKALADYASRNRRFGLTQEQTA